MSKSGVKSISKYHGLDKEALGKLSTRELLACAASARGRIICSCGKGHHCGDDVLASDEKAWNDAQRRLQADLREILAGREHLGSSKPEPRREKKALAFRRKKSPA